MKKEMFQSGMERCLEQLEFPDGPRLRFCSINIKAKLIFNEITLYINIFVKVLIIEHNFDKLPKK
jgi:uncharacterized radical SAM superfamily Fe-S cluster-containing enzyme